MKVVRPESQQPIPPHATKVFSGVVFDVYQWQQELFDGSTATFEKLRRPDTVVVFPVLPDGRILLTEQEQPGKQPFLGATGGRVDPGEDVLEAAKRELREESSYEADTFLLLDAQHPTSKIDWVVFTFIAKNLRKVGEPHLEAGERITLKPVTFDEFLDLGTGTAFAEKEIQGKLFAARLDATKRKQLMELFSAT